MHSASTDVVWLFGRGLSIDCGLTWDVPREWNQLNREDRIDRIKHQLRLEMDSPCVNTQTLGKFIHFLGDHTRKGFRHVFITTNWDYLLQREVDRCKADLHWQSRPTWLLDSAVFHLNGTVENLANDQYRSPFLLTDDSTQQRTLTVEANKAFTLLTWQRVFILMGMSFECETDRNLLWHLNQIEDHLPIGESRWFIVNPDGGAATVVRDRLHRTLPAATFCLVQKTFTCWRMAGFPELWSEGIFA